MTTTPSTTVGLPGLVLLRRTESPSTAALDLLDRVARFDAEMGFGPPRPDRSPGVGTATVIEIDTCLHRHDVDHDDAYVLAGVLTIRDLGDGTGTAELVVDPVRRAIGVATAVLEELGTAPDPERGWAATGLHALHAVAHGSHPAAERLARRSAVATSAVRHHLLLPAGEPTPSGSAEPVHVHAIGPRFDDGDRGDDVADDREVVRLEFAAGSARVQRPGPKEEPPEISDVAAVPGSPGDERGAAVAAVVGSTVARLRARGAGDIEAVADADDELLAEALRRLRFEHDRSDLVFHIGRNPSI